MRTLRSAAAILLALSASTYVFINIKDARIQELTQEVDRLESQRQQLADFARRVTQSRRVAQVDILEQTFSPSGETQTLLRFQEIGDGGTIGDPIYRDVIGDLVYFEAATLKFDHDLVGNDASEQTTSLAIFRRIFGDRQIAANVADLFDSSASDEQVLPTGGEFTSTGSSATAGETGIPSSGRSLSDFALWEMFWRFMTDPDLAATYGVRIAQVEAPAIAPKTGQKWQLTLDASGGLNLLLIDSANPPSSNEENIATARP
jgi:hypothetical protein